MKIETKKENEVLVITLCGRLDTTSAPSLEKEIEKSLFDVTSLVFDLKNLEYTSSAGLRIFLKAQKLMTPPKKMKIINVSSDIKEIFDITGFSQIMDIE